MLVPRVRSDGSETGELDSADVIVQTGSYSYIAPDGTVISVHYVADENGFQAFGDHLPVSPPIPEPILNALQHNQRLEEQPTHQLPVFQGKAHCKLMKTAKNNNKYISVLKKKRIFTNFFLVLQTMPTWPHHPNQLRAMEGDNKDHHFYHHFCNNRTPIPNSLKNLNF